MWYAIEREKIPRVFFQSYIGSLFFYENNFFFFVTWILQLREEGQKKPSWYADIVFTGGFKYRVIQNSRLVSLCLLHVAPFALYLYTINLVLLHRTFTKMPETHGVCVCVCALCFSRFSFLKINNEKKYIKNYENIVFVLLLNEAANNIGVQDIFNMKYHMR